jgi:hemolysin III
MMMNHQAAAGPGQGRGVTDLMAQGDEAFDPRFGAVRHISPAQAVASATAAVKPKLRGWFHAGAFPFAVAAGIVLITLAPTPRAAAASAVFAVSSWLLFGVSAIYHRGTWGPRWSAILRRLDHTNIFLIIAGTYTPVSLLLLSRTSAEVLLSLVWAGALIGIGMRVFWIDAPRWVYVPCYLALGWAALFYLPAFLRSGGWGVVGPIIAGGLLYSAGAVVYALKKPNPSPRWFGFHEIFHLLTVAAFVCHYVAISVTVYTASR